FSRAVAESHAAHPQLTAAFRGPASLTLRRTVVRVVVSGALDIPVGWVRVWSRRSGRQLHRLTRLHHRRNRFRPRAGSHHPHDGGVQAFGQAAESGGGAGGGPEVPHEFGQLYRERVDQFLVGGTAIAAV